MTGPRLWEKLAAPFSTRKSAQAIVDRLRRTAELLGDEATWGAVVTRYEADRSASQSSAVLPPLAIDWLSLLDAGVTPRSPIDTDSVVSWLRRDNLALVVHADAVLLTSLAKLSGIQSPLIYTENQNVVVAPLCAPDGSAWDVRSESNTDEPAWLARKARHAHRWFPMTAPLQRWDLVGRITKSI